MITYIMIEQTPKSYNLKFRKSDNYKAYLELISSYAKDQIIDPQKTWITDVDARLYTRVYYFHKGKRSIDADNLSKPIHDALVGIVYKDDSNVEWRVASKIDTNRDFTLTTDNLPIDVFEKLQDILDSEKFTDLILVEIGEMDTINIKFGRESNGI